MKHRTIRASSIQAKREISIPGELVPIKASEGSTELPKVKLRANGGNSMRLPGFDIPVVINLSGAKFNKPVTPIILDHDTTKRLGHTTQQEVSSGAIEATGVISSTTEVAKEFLNDMQNGLPFQVSVGAEMLAGYMVNEEDTVMVNDRLFQGPLIVAEEVSIRELTATLLGADSDTSITLAAKRKEDMQFEKWLAAKGFKVEELSDSQKVTLKAAWKAEGNSDPAPTPTPSPTPAAVPTLDLEAMREQQAKEVERTTKLGTLVAQYQTQFSGKEIDVNGTKMPLGTFHAHAVKTGMNPNDFELTLLRCGYSEPTPAVHMRSEYTNVSGKALSCALVKQSGLVPASRVQDSSGEKWGYEHFYDQKTLEASDDSRLRNLSIHQLMDLMIIQAKGHPYAGNRKSDEFIRAARESMTMLKANAGFSTLTVDYVFEDAANKMLLAAYNGVNTTWQEWCAVKSVSDFKTHNMYRLTHTGGYQQIGADGELKHGGFSDEKYTLAADTYGKMVGMTRKDLINDDMNAFGSIMNSLGMEGARTVEELVYVYFFSVINTLFPTAGTLNNYIEGASSALSLTSLDTAVKNFENQVDVDNAPIGIEADRILVGTALRVTASDLFNEARIENVGTTGTKSKEFTRNQHVGAFRPIITPFLNNTRIKQRVASVGSAISALQSDTLWFMFGNPAAPQGACINVAFLNGVRVPILESSDASFNVLGLQWRAYHDVGVGSGDPKLGLRSKGAA